MDGKLRYRPKTFIRSFISNFMSKMNLSTCTNTSLIIPLGTFTDLSASRRVTEVGFKSPRLRFWKTEYESKFTLAPISSKALSILCSPIKQEIVGQPGVARVRRRDNHPPSRNPPCTVKPSNLLFLNPRKILCCFQSRVWFVIMWFRDTFLISRKLVKARYISLIWIIS